MAVRRTPGGGHVTLLSQTQRWIPLCRVTSWDGWMEISPALKGMNHQWAGSSPGSP